MKLFPYCLAAIFFGSAVCVSGAEPVGNSAVESISLNNITMKEAARLISVAAGIPIVVSRDAAGVVVDLQLRGVDIDTALDAVCRAGRLWRHRDEKSGMVHIQTVDEFKDTLQFAGKDTVKVVQILYPSARDIADALSKLFINRVIWTAPRKTSGDSYYAVSRALKRMDLLGDRGTFDITDTNTRTSTDDSDDDDDNDGDEKKKEAKDATKVDLSKVKGAALNQLLTDEKLRNDLRYHEITSNPGVVFLSVLPESNSLMLRSADAAAIDQMLTVIEKLDKPSPQVLLEVKVLSVKLDDTMNRAVDFLFASNDGKISGGFADGLLSTGGGQEILKPDSNLVPQGSGIDTQAAIFNAVTDNFRARVQMLEKDERITRLATPNLIVGNNESSSLFIGDEVTVMEKAQQTVTYTEVSSGTFQPNISWEIDAPRRKIGTSLLLAPKIHADRTVTLRLLQEHSTLGSERKSAFSGETVNSATEEQYFISQDINMQRLVTTAIGQDRKFIVIGGLIEEAVEKTTEKTPFLSEIPILGELAFTRLEAERVRKEILVIVRPFVMLAPGEAQAVSREYLERMSQHPAARDDLPALGVNTPNELAKPRVVDPNDPWLLRMWDQLNVWGVDDTKQFELYPEIHRRDRRENHRKAIDEINTILVQEEQTK